MGRLQEPQVGAGGRLLSLSGIVAVALILLSFVVLGGDTPGSGDSAATINSFYDAHSGSSFAASFVLAAAAPFLVLFAVCLALAFWPEDGRRSAWPFVLIAGGATAALGFMLAALVHFALTDGADQDAVPGAALQALNTLDTGSWVAFNAGLGVLMLGAAGTLLASRAYPVLAWIAVAAGVALFIPFADFAGLIVSGLWIIATSIVLFRRQGAANLGTSADVVGAPAA